MQPFDKHPANVDSLESCGGELVTEGANGLQTGTRTRKAYQPAITNVGGSCSSLVQAAGEPVDEASEAVNSSLIWAAVVSRYWGKQVKAFNAKVDEITSALVAQRPNFGVEVPTGPPSPGGPPDTSDEDIAEAMAAAIADAKHKWYQAYTQYIEDGGRQTASMLKDGPTEANMTIARDAGALPPMTIKPLDTFVKGLERKVEPTTNQELPGVILWGANALVTPATWLQSWGAKLHANRFAPRDPLTGRSVPIKGTSWWRQSLRVLSGSNWVPKFGQAGAAYKWAKLGTSLKWGGIAISGASGAWDQWSRDSGRDDLSDAAKVTRAATRGGLKAGAGWAGAWGGVQAGGAIGFAVGGPVGVVIGGAVGGTIGFVIGSGVGNVVADWTVDATGDAGDWAAHTATEAWDDAAEVVNDVDDFASDTAEKLKFW